jgi:Haem-binding domain
MKKYLKILGFFLLGAFVIIQFFRPKKNINKGAEAVANDIAKVVTVPDNIKQILDRACNDCHSNNTRYPWYANIMPFGWIINNHVVDGKKHLNFNEFAAIKGNAKRTKEQIQAHKLEEVADEVKEGKMPISNYTKLHKTARLTDAEKQALINWATDARQQIITATAAGANVVTEPVPPPK